ncbi:phosphate regulon sensor histidine kinase PhoR [Glaesserella sp.]|uniref:phosphate regulon sensor histidine kinase PhoR n=1 Tax=Glaesserella sp. TaxID=2094731 RepID=UPI0035A05B39
MNAIFSVLLRLVLAVIVIAGLTYLAFGAHAMWIAMTMTLAVWIAIELFYLSRLLRWQKNPQHNLQGMGIWDVIFSRLLEQTKESVRRKRDIITSLDRFNRVAEAIPNGLLILNREGRIEWFNQLAIKHLNLNAEEDQNGFLQNIIRLPEFQRFLQKKLQNEPLVIKISLPNSGYLPRIILVQRFIFETYNELLVTQDISDKEQLDANQINFVANVSHELRTPLTVINGFVETLSDNPDLPLEQRRQFLSLMQKEGERMLSVLSDLLILSRLEKGQTRPFETFDLSRLVEQVVQEGRNLSKDQHIFTVHIDEGVQFNGVQNEVYSALSNLVFNAVRYTPEKGEITVSLHKVSNKQVIFSVKDTGIGIPAEHISRLSERFYRVDNSRSRQNGGTGLGLAIAKFALAKYNTQLDIESEVGKGSLFSVKLPLA